MLSNDISHTFIDSVRQKFIDLGFPIATSGQISKIILPFKVDTIEKKVFSRCENFFYLEQIIKPYQEEIHDIVKKCWGDNFMFEIDNTLDHQDTNPGIDSQKIPSTAIKNPPVLLEDDINESENHVSSFTFKNFVAGKCNETALNSCQYIAKNYGKFAESFFIYGHTGLGKTHLLHAVGNEIYQKNKNARLIYVTSHDFINDVIHRGIRLGKMEDVRKKYRYCDVLLVDDLQIFEKKAVCQAEFLHILNFLLQRKKLVIITANKPPKDFKHLDARLKSKLLQGVMSEISPPNQEDRIGIIRSKCKKLNLNLSEDLVNFIAPHLKTNVQEIEGALNDLAFKYASVKKTMISRQNILNVIQQRFPSHLATKKNDLIFIQKTVSQYFNIDINELKGKQRNRKFTLARHIAIYIAVQTEQFKTREIAEAFNRTHHKIVLYAVKKIRDLIQTNIEIKGHIEALNKKLS